jgi:hypothetical protein
MIRAVPIVTGKTSDAAATNGASLIMMLFYSGIPTELLCCSDRLDRDYATPVSARESAPKYRLSSTPRIASAKVGPRLDDIAPSISIAIVPRADSPTNAPIRTAAALAMLLKG